MKYAPLNDTTYALRLERGDLVHTTLEAFCAEHDIANATVAGIGSLESPKLAHYSITTRRYSEHSLDGIFEVLSLAGNIALVDGRPKAHLHVTVSGPDMQARGGHLVIGECSATLEVVVTAYPSHHTKTHDEQIGLFVWDF